MFEAAGLVTKGKDAAGVARQECGTLGKVANGQGGVLAGSASRQGYVLVEQRLFLPAVWLSPAYAARRATCRGPEELRWQTKPQWAAARWQRIRPAELRPFRYIVADSVDGNSPDVLATMDAGGGATALVAISSETRCWLQRPGTQEQGYR